jgi:hypothetical protein
MSYIKWSDWIRPRAWRNLAEEHTDELGEEYVVIGQMRDDDDEPFELLKLSRYSARFDADKLALHTSIRVFDNMPVEMSRRTRDLGIVRFITKKGTPIFVLEPGADVLRWMAIREGIPERELVNIARRGEVGRAVRRKDRRALKSSRQEAEATIRAYKEHIHSLESQLAQAKLDLGNAEDAHARMVKNIVNENERNGEVQSSSGTMSCVLGTAEDLGYKPVSDVPLPGHFGG